MSNDGKKPSIFDNDEFCNGFVMFYESADFEKYMKPFLGELIEVHRDALEKADDAKAWQNRLKAIRGIEFMAEALRISKRERIAALEDSRRQGDVG
jgi:hypothetical protein